MNSTLYITILLPFLWTGTWGIPTPDPKIDKGSSSSETSHPQIGVDEGATLACKCGKFGLKWKKRLDRNVAMGIFNQLVDSNMDVSSLAYYPVMIGKMLKICKHCEILYTSCDQYPDIKNGSQCKQNSVDLDILQNEINQDYSGLRKFVEDKVSPLFSVKVKRNLTKRQLSMPNEEVTSYPHRVHVPIGGWKERSKRQTGTCLYPHSLQSSELECVHYPKYVRCIQKCAMGHTLRGGTEIENTCYHKNDRWDNGAFRECKPFVDCTLTLMSGGKATCSAPTIFEGPNCEIRCNKYEDKESIVVESSCNIEGQWRPALPYCANPGSGLKLVDKNGNADYYSKEDEPIVEDDQLEEYVESNEVEKQNENEIAIQDDSNEDENQIENQIPEQDDERNEGEKRKNNEIHKYDESKKDVKQKADKIPAKENDRKVEKKQKKSHTQKGNRKSISQNKEIKTQELDDLDYYNDYEDSSEED